MKIARYKAKYSEIICEFSEDEEDSVDYIRNSEVLEVEFVDLPAEVLVPKQVAALDAAIVATRTRSAQEIERLEDEKSKLLAITHTPECPHCDDGVYVVEGPGYDGEKDVIFKDCEYCNADT